MNLPPMLGHQLQEGSSRQLWQAHEYQLRVAATFLIQQQMGAQFLQDTVSEEAFGPCPLHATPI